MLTYEFHRRSGLNDFGPQAQAARAGRKQGTVIATDWSGVQIEWDNGKTQFFITTT